MDEQLYHELSELVVAKDKYGLMEKLSELDETARAEFARRQRLEKELSTPYDNKPRCADGQLGKFCLIEYSNVNREFETLTSLLTVSNYLYERLSLVSGHLAAQPRSDTSINQQDEKSKLEIIKEFLDTAFNHRYSKHVDTVYDVFIKPLASERSKMMGEVSDSQMNPAYIPTAETVKFDEFAELIVQLDKGLLNGKIVECLFVDDVSQLNEYCSRVATISQTEYDMMYAQAQAFIAYNGKLTVIPSYWQYRNLLNFYNAKLEEHRFLASRLTAIRPTNELLLHVHGVFANTDEMEAYRIKKSANIHGKAVVCPIGRTALGDDFRANRDGIIMYNPADPEIEIMMQGKHNVRRVEAEAVKARMSKVSDRTDPKTLSRIRKWKQEREKLTKGKAKILSKYANTEAIEIDAKVENAITALDGKIHDALSMLDDDEVVFDTLEVKDGKLSKGEELIMKVE
jgi:hypothetical protein